MAYDRSSFGDDFLAFDQDLILQDFSQTVTYKRGGDSISISAIPGDVVTAYDDRTGIDVAIGDGSFWLKCDDLDFGDGVFMPKIHDKITTGEGIVFEVLDPGRMDSERILNQVPVVRVDFPQPGKLAITFTDAESIEYAGSEFMEYTGA